MDIQAASTEHTQALAQLINLAGEGIPLYLWKQLAEPGQDPMALGASRAARSEGAFSYYNAEIALDQEQVAGMVIAYGLPKPYKVGDLDDYPPFIQPLIQLEAKAAGSWYINGIAVFAKYQRHGYAQALLQSSIQKARHRGFATVSLIVASNNLSALALYKKLGFQQQHSLAMNNPSVLELEGDWQLYTLDIA